MNPLYCRQKYEYSRLLAISEAGEQYVDEFRYVLHCIRKLPNQLVTFLSRFPFGCVCYSQRDKNFQFEYGRSDGGEYQLAGDQIVDGNV